MDKNLRAQVFETYNRYLNAFNEADMETINDCISYPWLISELIQLKC